ncbi:MAG: hypothetical protein HDT01_04910 [Bacteroidales bacterium]|nr:hypothetical protein [Bacteroidales bacterium]
MWRFYKNIIQLIISPDNGWVDIQQTSIPQRAMLGAIWMIIVVAFSPLLHYVYGNDTMWLNVVKESIMILISMGLTYFIAGMVMNTWIPKINGGVENKDKVTIFAAYVTSLLSLQILITNILPLSFAILTLWPVYVAVIMWRGMHYMDVDARNTGKFMAVVILSLIVPSQLLIKFFLIF